MKRMAYFGLVLAMLSMTLSATAGSSNGLSEVRKHARFISDRMAYELGLNDMQYEDVYEVNFDFIYNTRPYMDGFAMRYSDDIDRYFYFLDIRNDDLRYILTYAQYERFMATEYFFRPVHLIDNGWEFRIYRTYTNTTYFYFNRPAIYTSYRGAHDRAHFNNDSFYRLNHDKRYGVSHNYYTKPVVKMRDNAKNSYRNDGGSRAGTSGKATKRDATTKSERNSKRTYTSSDDNKAKGTTVPSTGNKNNTRSNSSDNAGSRRTTTGSSGNVRTNSGSTTRTNSSSGTTRTNSRTATRNVSTSTSTTTTTRTTTSTSTNNTDSGTKRTAKRTR